MYECGHLDTGELDHWTTSAPCAQLVSSIRASSQDAAITLYPGAHHAFDNVTLGYIHLSNACLRKGATIAGNAEGAARARRNVRSQLGEVLK